MLYKDEQLPSQVTSVYSCILKSTEVKAFVFELLKSISKHIVSSILPLLNLKS